jgi:hypothetical protein
MSDIKNLSEQVRKCEGSATHNKNYVKLNIFSFVDNVPTELGLSLIHSAAQ